ncbi:MAG: EndoU domain-containing protein [Wolbachia endosymbiont of Tyrophagus putrescentiae]|nr:EndoU domain-containing protein [Wolbachia endosymbiont of Tyrophagus putrescentiae]
MNVRQLSRLIPLLVPLTLTSAVLYRKIYTNQHPKPTDIKPTKFNKFFKTESFDPDYLAPFPKLSEFDREVLKVCGDWGSKPTREDFKKFLDDPKNKKDVQDIYEGLDKQVITPNADLETFKKEFLDVWFGNRGFVHTFCGEPDGHKQWTSLGGMHFIGRYLEAQEKGWAGLWDGCDKKEIRPPVWTIGIRYKNTKGEIKEKCPGGFDYSSAKEILIYATKACKAFQKHGARKEGTCLYPTSKEYQSMLHVDNFAILSFFSTLSLKAERCGAYLEQVDIKGVENNVNFKSYAT